MMLELGIAPTARSRCVTPGTDAMLYVVPEGTPCGICRLNAGKSEWQQHVTQHENVFKTCDWRAGVYLFHRDGWRLRVASNFVEERT